MQAYCHYVAEECVIVMKYHATKMLLQLISLYIILCEKRNVFLRPNEMRTLKMPLPL